MRESSTISDDNMKVLERAIEHGDDQVSGGRGREDEGRGRERRWEMERERRWEMERERRVGEG